MGRSWKLRAALCAFLVGSLAVCTSLASPKDDSPIETIMKKGFNKGSLRHQISNEVDKDKPNWDTVEKNAKDLQKLCETLCKEKPPQGEADSWKKLTEALSKQSKNLTSAAGRRDLSNTKEAIKFINNSCKDCHDVHRP